MNALPTPLFFSLSFPVFLLSLQICEMRVCVSSEELKICSTPFLKSLRDEKEATKQILFRGLTGQE